MFWYLSVKFSGENFCRVVINWEKILKLVLLYGIIGGVC